VNGLGEWNGVETDTRKPTTRFSPVGLLISPIVKPARRSERVVVENNKISEYHVNMKVTFVLKD